MCSRSGIAARTPYGRPMPLTTILIAIGFFIAAHHMKLAGEMLYAFLAAGVGLWFLWPGWPAAAYRMVQHALHGVSPGAGPLIAEIALLASVLYACKLIFDHRGK